MTCQVHGLGKRFGSSWLFRDLSFDLEAGDSLVVTGPNGCGKSTLLRLLAGLDSPSEGTIQKGGVGYSALDMALYPALTPWEHLTLAAQMRGVDHRASELLQQVRLLSAKDKPAEKLSSGMRGRLKLALAIQAKPALLLLDEPGVALDEQGQTVVSEIVEAQRLGGAVVIATNDEREWRYASHRLQLDS
jgi:ABC-type multidrug transport system ATPase subunit